MLSRSPAVGLQNLRACAPWVIGFGSAVLGLAAAWAQAPAVAGLASAPAAAAQARSSLLTNSIAVPLWRDLSSQQQQSLSPLMDTWNALSDGHRRKWIALAKNYPTLPTTEQVKLHSRMAEWAALKPKDRELARLNFSETKKLSPPNRASDWEAYQALTPEERDRLAAKAVAKPPGAATAIKPVAPDKLAVVPVTRQTPQPVRELVISKQALDRKTLLPATALRAKEDAPSPAN
jgi:Protein of unknown function (DUF3106)